MNDELRKSLPGDEPQLKRLWREVFGNSEETIDGFFRTLYTPGMAQVYSHEGEIVSAAYVLKLGDFVSEGRWTPCKVIYAYGTREGMRGRGYGGRVLSAAIEEATRSGLGVICPAEPSLFPYYERYGFKPVFGAMVRDCTDVGLPLSGSATHVSIRGYAALREELLHGREHIDYDIRVIEYQEQLCNHSGGGLFYLVAGNVRCCAAVEVEEGRALIRELLVPSGSIYNAAALAARAVSCPRFSYRTPLRQGDTPTPFAMLHTESVMTASGSAWFGFAFDCGIAPI